jgi:hypothetical protein
VSSVAAAQAAPVRRNERVDRWWIQPLLVVVVLTLFSVYALWAALQNANYYAAPYLSPFYSPCLTTTCEHVTLPLFGAWWFISPAFIVLGIPLGFRVTCYYYRRAYYRSFFWSPPACAVPDARGGYSGETKFPFILQNIHRYLFWLAFIVLAFLWWDVIIAFRFPDGFGLGLGTLVLLANVVLLSGYSFSCHSCRYLAGGYLDSFAKKKIRFFLWRITQWLNPYHGLFAWLSLFSVVIADVYVRLLATGVISDVRFF